MKSKKLSEKRKHLRFITKNKINVQDTAKKQKKDSQKKIFAIAKNISAEGIRFKSKEKFEPGTKVGVEIAFPVYKSKLWLEGKIAWSQAVEAKKDKGLFDTGVKLLTIGKGDESRYIGYLYGIMMQKISDKP
jgi:hypothetical protein